MCIYLVIYMTIYSIIYFCIFSSDFPYTDLYNSLFWFIHQFDFAINGLMSMSMVVTLLIALILDNTVPGTRQERGVYIWSHPEDLATDPSVHSDYSLPRKVSRFFCCLRWSHAQYILFQEFLSCMTISRPKSTLISSCEVPKFIYCLLRLEPQRWETNAAQTKLVWGIYSFLLHELGNFSYITELRHCILMSENNMAGFTLCP